MAVGTALSRLSGLARLFALSYALGVTPLADAYNLANTTPNMVYDLVLGGVLSATLIPVFVTRLREDGEQEAWEAVSAVVTVATVLLVGAAVCVAAGAGLLVRGYTAANPLVSAGAERAVAVRLLQLFAPQVLLYGTIATATAVLNSLRRFALAAFAPIANNLVVVAVLLAAAGRLRHLPLDRALDDPTLLAVLGVGTTAGVVAQALVVAAGLRPAGARLHWRWRPRHPAVRQVARLSGWTFAMTAANQAALFAVLLLADTRPGGVSAYTYAYAFFQLPFGVVAVSVTAARQPAWAAAWAAGRVRELREQVADGLRLLVVLMVPIAAVLAALADPLVRLLLGHGATGAAGAALTGRVLAVLALGLPGFSAYLYFVRVYQALQELGAAFRLYLLNNGLMVALAAVLYRPAGVPGVAAAVSTAYTVAALAAAVLLHRRLAVTGQRPLTAPGVVARAVANGLAAGGPAWLTVRRLGATGGFGALPPLLCGAAVSVSALGLAVLLSPGAGLCRSGPAAQDAQQATEQPDGQEGQQVAGEGGGHVPEQAGDAQLP